MTVASVEQDLQVTMSRQVKIIADKAIADVAGESFDLIALPVSCSPHPLFCIRSLGLFLLPKLAKLGGQGAKR